MSNFSVQTCVQKMARIRRPGTALTLDGSTWIRFEASVYASLSVYCTVGCFTIDFQSPEIEVPVVWLFKTPWKFYNWIQKFRCGPLKIFQEVLVVFSSLYGKHDISTVKSCRAALAVSTTGQGRTEDKTKPCNLQLHAWNVRHYSQN